ncbi:MAG: hypothetical protein JW976_14320 [Syntrophaceae bacterium]|nr:hypothetical protein [Syntrophaceae bacterium]
MTLAENESRQVGTTFEAEVELSRTAEGTIVPVIMEKNKTLKKKKGT